MEIIVDWKKFNFNKHIFFNCSNEINNIIEPLIKHFGLNSFVFCKNYNDGSEIRLTNQPEWAKYYYINQLYKKSQFENNSIIFNKQFLIWSHLPNHKPILDEAKKFGIDYGITLINPTEDGVEFYFLGTTLANSNIINKYISNIDLLDKFSVYFKNVASKLIHQAYNERLIINNKLSTSSNTTNKLSLVERDEFLMDIMQIKLTRRELDCAKYLAKGFTSKMIAIQLNISYRTVEEYINKLKQKTGQYTKVELVSYFNQWFL